MLNKKTLTDLSGQSVISVLVLFSFVGTLFYWTTAAISTANSQFVVVRARNAINNAKLNIQSLLQHNPRALYNSTRACYHDPSSGSGIYFNDGALRCLRDGNGCNHVGDEYSLALKTGSQDPASPNIFFYNPGNSVHPNIFSGTNFNGVNNKFDENTFLSLGGYRYQITIPGNSVLSFYNALDPNGQPVLRAADSSLPSPNAQSAIISAIMVSQNSTGTCPDLKIALHFAYDPGPSGQVDATFNALLRPSQYDINFIVSSASVCGYSSDTTQQTPCG